MTVTANHCTMKRSKRTWVWYLNPWRYVLFVLRRVFRYSGVRFLNFIVQRVLGINDDIPWSVHYTSQVSGDIEIGAGVEESFAVSGNCYVQGINGIRIGEGTVFASGVKVISANHSTDKLTGWDPCRPIEIGRHCWLASNVTVCPGVHIGDYAIVGANAVVTSDIPERAVAVGVPARVIRYRALGDAVGD